MNHNFAYIEGQEIEALDYFEKRLQVTMDKEEQIALQTIVDSLKKKVLEKHGRLPKPNQPFLTLKSA